MAKTKVVICPYCGESQPANDLCRACGGYFDDLSRQATHNDMGPWFIRIPRRPFQPGCSYETLIKLIERGQIDKYTIIRGPTSKQYWTIARRIPGFSHLLGYCHNCDAHVNPDDHGCAACGEPFGAYLERNLLGLPDIKPMPWEATIEEADHSSDAVQRPAGSTGSRGISSFASDSEIAGNPNGDAFSGSRTVDGTSDYEESQFQTHYEPIAIPGAAPGMPAGPGMPASPGIPGISGIPEYSDPISASTNQATRSLRRKLDKQQRLITALSVVLVFAIALALLSNLSRFAAAPNEKAEDSNSASVKADETREVPKPAETFAKEEAPNEISEQDDNRFEEAKALISRADNDELSIVERLADTEKALGILRSLRSSLSESQQPDDLATLIEQLEKNLERLKLREFFP